MGQVVELLPYMRWRNDAKKMVIDKGIKSGKNVCGWREYKTGLFIFTEITDTRYKGIYYDIYCSFPFLSLLNPQTAKILPFRKMV